MGDTNRDIKKKLRFIPGNLVGILYGPFLTGRYTDVDTISNFFMNAINKLTYNQAYKPEESFIHLYIYF